MPPLPNTIASIYGGHKIPDFDANLRFDKGWGSDQLMGAVHQVCGDNTVLDSALGWAVGAGVTFNLSMIAAGDSISFQAAYANGAVQYVSSNMATDAVATSTTNISTATAWGIGGGFTHYWAPTLASSLIASHASLDAVGTNQDVNQVGVQGNLVWKLVSGLDIGVEVEYLSSNWNVVSGIADADDLVGILRVERTSKRSLICQSPRRRGSSPGS